MYCPCCGFKNSESASYCRSCGADPQTMCEALEGGIPAASAAKLLLRKVEERLGRRTEFFRLQTISALIWAAAFFGFQIHSHHWPFPLSMPFFIPLMALFLSLSGKGYLVYKRSKTFYRKSKRRAELPTSLFCPGCGTQSSFETGQCGSCGQSLEVVRRALQGEPSKLARMLDDEIARADGVFARWGRGKLICLALTMLIASGINSLGIAAEYSKIDGLLMLLVYSPSWLVYLQLLMTRQRERALWSPDVIKRNADRITNWLAANPAAFETQGVGLEFLAADAGMRGIEEAEAALDLLENQEIVVRQPDKTAAWSILVKPGRFWPQTLAASRAQSSLQAPSLGSQTAQVLDDLSTKTTRALTH